MPRQLTRSMELLLAVMRDGLWRTPDELTKVFHGQMPWPSINARLRDLRKVEWGGYRIIRRYRAFAARRVWEYAWCQCRTLPCHHDESGSPTYPITL
jgi:hypothetical protein